MAQKQKPSDPPGYVLGRHDYDRATILWAEETNGWGRLRGPLAENPGASDAAVSWARAIRPEP